MTVPAVEGLLTTPYVTVDEFRTSPTWLDTNNLVTTAGATQAQQDAELFNVLLRASAWADNYCEQRLSAHTVVEQTRARADRWGRIFLHPSNTPVRQVTGVAYGTNFQNLTLLSDLTQTWVEDARGILVSIVPMRGSFSGTLEFGGAPAGDCELYVQYSYVAGYGCTTLTGPTAAGATQLPVADATGFQPPASSLVGPLRGSVARIWEPAKEEAVVLAPNYVAGASPLLLTSPTLNAHVAGASVSEMPAEVHQAVISLTVALLTREDVSDAEPFAESEFGPSLRRANSGGKGGGLIEDAWMLLDPYRRVR